MHDPSFSISDCMTVVREFALADHSCSFFLAVNKTVRHFNPMTRRWDDIGLTTNQLDGVLEFAKEVALVAALKGETISV